MSLTENIQKIASRLLSEGTVTAVIGFQQSTVPTVAAPVIIQKEEDVHRLIWDDHCWLNLANYLTPDTNRVGIVAKGCDARNIIVHIMEHRIARDKLYIIGIPCQGMKDANGDLQENCAQCQHKSPVLVDEMVETGQEVAILDDTFDDINAIETMTSSERQAYFKDLFSTCIRCYACRNACPLCYCPVCFVDDSKPQWVGKSQDMTDVLTFHFLRAFHCAGRCTNCGACERACPMNINMRILTRKLHASCKELYDWEAGLSLDSPPPLETYIPTDPDAFIK